MGFELLPWHWIVLGFGLIIVEIFIASFFIIWFGAAAVLVGIALFLFPELSQVAQLIIWAVVSSVLAFVWTKHFKPTAGASNNPITQQDVKGEMGLVLTPPVNDKPGTLRFPAPVCGADEWLITSDQELSIGDRVTVIDIHDNVLFVEQH